MDYVGAIDIGGTKILVGIVNELGKVICSEMFFTIKNENGALNSCEKIIYILNKMQNKNNINIIKLGIVSAGPIDSTLGTIENPFTLMGWENFNIVEYMSLALKIPVALENDVNGTLLGEIEEKGLYDKSVLTVSIGTGIGAAYYDGEKLYKTSGRFHPELGHQIVDIEGEECYCKNRGCFESLCSGNALNKRSYELGFESFTLLLNAYNNGDNKLKNFIDRVELQYRNGFWNLLSVFKPEVFILSGGFALANSNFFKQLFYRYFSNFEEFIGNPSFMLAQDNGLSTLIGASKLNFCEL